jgi:tetratricopeptide (TPR) repeat protein
VSPPALPLRRKLLYAAVLTVAGTAVLFAALELSLRLAGYGYSPHFARRVTLPGGEQIWRDNRWCTAPFFSPALVRRPLPFRLPAAKPPGTYRIFVLGSSAAMGDPEPSFSFARILAFMLRDAFPQVRFEVVDAAITAINSHLDRLIAGDCARLSPDLFIVYEGQNEVIGPFGPSGVFTPFLGREPAIRAAVALKSTRTAQLAAAARRTLAGEHGAPAGWGGMEMFLQQQIAAADPRLDAVRAHFRANLLAIAAAARGAGARTLLCTVLANQRDFAPFLSQHRPDLSPADLARWNAHFEAAERAQRAGDFAAAESAYRAALAIDDRYAELVFRLGRLALQAGRDDEARSLLQRALDLDTLRFRPDSSLEQVIRDAASAESARGVELVDLASTLAARCAHGVPGDDLLYEHVHLNFRGAYEIARELFPRVAADLVRRRLVSGPIPEPFDLDQARVRLGYTTYDQALIAFELVNRFRRPPFTGQSDHALRLAVWQRRAESANTLLARPDALPALHELYRRALALAPDDWILARNAGAMLVARHDAADALPLLQRAAAWIDDDLDTLVPLGWAQRELGHRAESEINFARARTLDPHYPNLPPD